MLVRIWSVLIIFCLLACQPAAKLYRSNRTATGTLPPKQFDSLKNYLQAFNSAPLNDTLIIKYEFADATCWDLLDRQSDEYIAQVIRQKQNSVSRAAEQRTGVSIFRLKEAGEKFNANILRDSTVKTGSGALQRWLFSERTICGTSAVVLPGGQYVLLKSDSHFESLHWTKEQIEKVFR